MACAESITDIDQIHEHITSTDTLLVHVEPTTDMDHTHEHITSIDTLPDDVLLRYSTSVKWVSTLPGRTFAPCWNSTD